MYYRRDGRPDELARDPAHPGPRLRLPRGQVLGPSGPGEGKRLRRGRRARRGKARISGTVKEGKAEGNTEDEKENKWRGHEPDYRTCFE